MNQNIAKWYEKYAGDVVTLSDDIWHHPESAMEEYHACKVVADFMRAQGFEVKEIDAMNEGGTSNCVIATYGSGKPVIGILGELDALNGLGQEAVPYQSAIPGPGHGCGHNLMGAGCGAAAAALKATMEAENLGGTLIYYGCPAEETIAGKVYMARDGWFDNLDMCIAWHPGGRAPTINEAVSSANTNMNFNFYGKTAHAAGNPEKGRSALDAAEIMNIGVNYLREHVSDDVRMHYVYTHGGEKPNIVPDYAQLHYFVRAKSRAIDDEVVERVKECARGASIITGTTTDWSLNAACYETFINHSINNFLYESALKIPAIEWDDKDREFAATMFKNETGSDPKEDLLPTEVVKPTGVLGYMAGSTDVSDVSHIVPTAQLMGPGHVKGLPGHHWTVTAASGCSIGHKAEIYAGKVLAQCGYDALKNPAAIDAMWAEFKEARKDMSPYKCVLPK